jgi:hypothetical protein
MNDEIEEYCKSILQRNVKFVLNDKKVLRRGKLMLYSTKDYFITFTIDTPKKIRKVYEIYYPFSIKNDIERSRLELSYDVEDLTTDPAVKLHVFNSVQKKIPPSPFFSSRLYIYYE